MTTEHPTDRISDADMLYHRTVCVRVNEAKAKYDRAIATGEDWFAHLAEKYGVPPETIIGLDGVFIYAPRTEADADLVDATVAISRTPTDEALPVADAGPPA